MSNRGLDTPDTEQYLFWFEVPPLQYEKVEQGYAWLCYFLNGLGFSFQEFLFVIAFLEMEIWLFCTTKLFPKANYNLMFALCLSFYGIYFWGCVLRASVAITIGYIALTILMSSKANLLNKLIIFYALIIIASSMHISALIYLICPFLNFNLGEKTGFILIAASIVTALLINQLGLSQYMSFVIGSIDDMERFNYYLLTETQDSLISLFWIISLAISCWFILRYHIIITKSHEGVITKYFSNLYFLGFLLTTITNKIPGGTRLGMMYTFFEFIIIYKIAESYKNPHIRAIIYACYISIRFAYMVHSIPLFLNY